MGRLEGCFACAVSGKEISGPFGKGRKESVIRFGPDRLNGNPRRMRIGHGRRCGRTLSGEIARAERKEFRCPIPPNIEGCAEDSLSVHGERMAEKSFSKRTLCFGENLRFASCRTPEEILWPDSASACSRRGGQNRAWAVEPYRTGTERGPAGFCFRSFCLTDENSERMESKKRTLPFFGSLGGLLLFSVLSAGTLCAQLAQGESGIGKAGRLDLEESIWLKEAGGPACRLHVSMDFFRDEAGGKERERPPFSLMNDSVIKAAFGPGFLGGSFLMSVARYRDALAESYRKETGQLYADMPQAASLDYEYWTEGEIVDTGVFFWTYRLENMWFTGGAHPVTVVRYMNFDENGMVGLEDVFGKDAEERLRPILFAALLRQEGVRTEEQLAKKSYFPEQFFVSRNFYFKDSKAYFVYNAYDIAPYSRGLVEIAVPVRALGEKVFLNSDD